MKRLVAIVLGMSILQGCGLTIGDTTTTYPDTDSLTAAVKGYEDQGYYCTYSSIYGVPYAATCQDANMPRQQGPTMMNPDPGTVATGIIGGVILGTIIGSGSGSGT